MTDKDTKHDISAIRQDYTLKSLTEDEVDQNPVNQFKIWFNEALKSEVKEPNAMSLGTVTKENKPAVRIVLLKGIENGKFRFFTNYQSQKGEDMANNPNVSLMFFWSELERQVRIEGIVSKVSEEESTAYFHSRPSGSQIGALVSPQSQVISGREELEERQKELTSKYEGKTIPKPTHWGGYEVDASSFEFWQGRSSRLHDRIRYIKKGSEWQIERLAP